MSERNLKRGMSKNTGLSRSPSSLVKSQKMTRRKDGIGDESPKKSSTKGKKGGFASETDWTDDEEYSKRSKKYEKSSQKLDSSNADKGKDDATKAKKSKATGTKKEKKKKKKRKKEVEEEEEEEEEDEDDYYYTDKKLSKSKSKAKMGSKEMKGDKGDNAIVKDSRLDLSSGKKGKALKRAKSTKKIRRVKEEEKEEGEEDEDEEDEDGRDEYEDEDGGGDGDDDEDEDRRDGFKRGAKRKPKLDRKKDNTLRDREWMELEREKELQRELMKEMKREIKKIKKQKEQMKVERLKWDEEKERLKWEEERGRLKWELEKERELERKIQLEMEEEMERNRQQTREEKPGEEGNRLRSDETEMQATSLESQSSNIKNELRLEEERKARLQIEAELALERERLQKEKMEMEARRAELEKEREAQREKELELKRGQERIEREKKEVERRRVEWERGGEKKPEIQHEVKGEGGNDVIMMIKEDEQVAVKQQYSNNISLLATNESKQASQEKDHDLLKRQSSDKINDISDSPTIPHVPVDSLDCALPPPTTMNPTDEIKNVTDDAMPALLSNTVNADIIQNNIPYDDDDDDDDAHTLSTPVDTVMLGDQVHVTNNSEVEDNLVVPYLETSDIDNRQDEDISLQVSASHDVGDRESDAVIDFESPDVTSDAEAGAETESALTLASAPPQASTPKLSSREGRTTSPLQGLSRTHSMNHSRPASSNLKAESGIESETETVPKTAERNNDYWAVPLDNPLLPNNAVQVPNDMMDKGLVVSNVDHIDEHPNVGGVRTDGTHATEVETSAPFDTDASSGVENIGSIIPSHLTLMVPPFDEINIVNNNHNISHNNNNNDDNYNDSKIDDDDGDNDGENKINNDKADEVFAPNLASTCQDVYTSDNKSDPDSANAHKPAPQSSHDGGLFALSPVKVHPDPDILPVSVSDAPAKEETKKSNVDQTPTLMYLVETRLLPHWKAKTVKSCLPILYRIRYSIVRYFTCPVPYLPYAFPIIGGRSVVELLIIAACFAGVLYYCIELYMHADLDSATQLTGKLSSYITALSVLLTCRNTPITIFFGLPFERGIYWHKIGATLGIIATGTHAYFALRFSPYLLPNEIPLFGSKEELEEGVHTKQSFSGEITNVFTQAISMVPTSMPTSSMPSPMPTAEPEADDDDPFLDYNNVTGLSIRFLMILSACAFTLKYYGFEYFYYSHVVVFVLILPLAYIHGARYLFWAGCFWAFDFAIRYIVALKVTKAEVKIDRFLGILNIELERSFPFAPGQFVFLNIPAISALQYHPFTISSAPHENVVRLTIRESGDWTEQLADLIEAKMEEDEENGLPVTISQYIDVCVEGPYGLLSVDINSPDYSVIVLVAGGIGATFTAGIFSHLQHLYRCSEIHKKKWKKIIYLWAMKDLAMFDAVGNTPTSSEKFQDPESFEQDVSPPPLNEFTSLFANGRGGGTPGTPDKVTTPKSPGNNNNSPSSRSFDGYRRRDVILSMHQNQQLFKDIQRGGSSKILPADATTNQQQPSMHRCFFTVSGMEELIRGRKVEPLSRIVSKRSFRKNKVHQTVTSDTEMQFSPVVFQRDIFVTGKKRIIQSRHRINSGSDCVTSVRSGRPDLPRVFRALSSYCINEGISRIAVLVCGPQGLVMNCAEQCDYHSTTALRIDLHREDQGAI